MASSLLALRTVVGQDHPALSGSAEYGPRCVPAQNVKLHCYQSFIDLYDQLRPLLHARLRGLGLTAEDAEDVAHESFLRLLRHLLEARTDENLRGWIFRVAHNLSMDVHRSNRHYQHSAPLESERGRQDHHDAADPAPDPEDVLIQEERFLRLQQGLMQLTVQQRNCVMLRAQGLRYREIASSLGISVQRVAKLLERSTCQLAANL